MLTCLLWVSTTISASWEGGFVSMTPMSAMYLSIYKVFCTSRCCSVAKLCLILCPPLSPRACSNSCPLNQCYYPTISSSGAHFSFCLPCFPSSGSFPMKQLFTSGGQSIGTSALPLVLPENIQGWFPLGLTGLLSLLSKGLSRLFSSTTIWKHPFFGAQPSLWSNSQILSLSVTQDECGGRKRTHIVSGRAVQGEL